ncbi:SWIM zinc finger domain-containing protein [Piscinibacter sp. XHJ-5]|uniref:SWIM zinc finger family protein n=1 Tax=Piscinibacter sp. XHJ-5 TaxID=3037797 RepID=UPI002452B7AC|nr:SWIM zinc finger domain-containing protein [Piscinibacter sp. XHJ-5]
MTAGLKDRLLEQLRRFDEDAFVALANKGLLRRAQKDLEKQAATISAEAQDRLELRFGEHTIRFDARGPAQASCSCPAAGVCQHILAAMISLQRMAAPAAADDDAPSAAGGSNAQADLSAALLAIPQAALERHAGAAGYRWAWQFVQDLDLPDDLGLGGDTHLVIDLKRPRLRLRYMGGGVDALIPDTETKQLAKYQVAAVLACRQALGADVMPPPARAKPKTAALDLGKDHALPEDVDNAEAASRVRLRASVQQVLQDCLQLGLSHLSPAMRDRFATLAVWAQGAQYHRLALLLRRVADHVELLLERAAGADEHRLFDELALVHGLLGALASADAKGAAPAHLVGRSRSEYAAASTLELIGVGASAWRSASGYVGLTMMFWSPEEQRFFSCTDARAELQRGFDPLARYKAPGPWSGLGAPQQATGRRVRLVSAQVNAQGRLSGSDTTHVTLQPAGALATHLQPIADWADLLERRAHARRSLLAEPQPLQDWVTLAPARFGAARFDPIRQTLAWPLVDAADRVLHAELVYSPFTEHAIQRIERLQADSLPPGTLLIGRLRPADGAPVLEPLSLVRGGSDNQIDALQFDDAPASSWASKWRQLMGRGAEAPALDAMASAAAAPRDLLALRHWLRERAERGLAEDAVAALDRDREAHRQRCEAAGLTALAQVLGRPVCASQWLAANYVCLQTERLLGRGDDAPA